jgi:hypothetical protein
MFLQLIFPFFIYTTAKYNGTEDRDLKEFFTYKFLLIFGKILGFELILQTVSILMVFLGGADRFRSMLNFSVPNLMKYHGKISYIKGSMIGFADMFSNDPISYFFFSRDKN